MSVLLIFEIQEINGTLFLKANFLSYALLSGFVTIIVATIYALLKSHRSDFSFDVLKLICLLALYLSSALPDWSWTSTYFLVINLSTLLAVVFSKFVIYWDSIFI